MSKISQFKNAYNSLQFKNMFQIPVTHTENNVTIKFNER